MRAELDGRNEKLSYKIREVQIAKVPYAVVIGDREVREQTVSPRRRGGETLPAMGVGEFMELMREEPLMQTRLSTSSLKRDQS
jgi:threonyl-tRNA synthetase